MARRRVGAIILAAGCAQRFGADKLLALYDGVPLIALAAGAITASLAEPRVLVVARERLDCYRSFLSVPGRTIRAVAIRSASPGLAHSLKAGLEVMPEGLDGIVIHLADMPQVDGPLINALIEAFDPSDYAVVPEYSDFWGNPALLGRAAMEDAKRLEGDAGARRLLRANAARVRAIPWDGRCLVDVDTIDDLARLG